MTSVLLVASALLLVGFIASLRWAGLDPRIPIATGIFLLGIAGVAEGLGSSGAANTYSEYAMFVIFGGMVLIAIDRVMPAGAEPPGTTAPPAHPPSKAPAAGLDF
jgi:hypothetical protein